ncbi:hypothetical protein ACFY19_27765 [Streptosporangium saharense]|uniref:hypothetical protein n=1 Tax=Streptosporangium saharense TaxID=1706840 RepID=UPI00368B581F
MHELELHDLATGSRSSGQVTAQTLGDECEVRLDLAGGPPLVVRSSNDFEDVLLRLRAELERQRLLLLCNRFRRDAFVSSMSRQMSDGLSCYLVTPHRPVSPEQLVDCLAPAPREAVVTAQEASKYIEEWIAGFE